MSDEKAKMLAGEFFDPGDPQLKADRLRARSLCQELNALSPERAEDKAQLLATLFGSTVAVTVTPPFFCDYGYNIVLGENAYFNVNCVVLDVARVQVGRNTLFGPGVHIYTPLHPLSAEERRNGLERGLPVVIGNDVWVGGGAIICPGVTIGDGSVIGAGSVVTRDIPPGVLAVGNPCRVVRTLQA